jgi:RNA polymerase sigma factor (sigma-70 family)
MVATTTTDEYRLHDLLLDHNIAALAEVYDRYASTVFGVALRVTDDRQAAEDVTQDVLLGLWQRPERFDPERGGLRPWLATIAHNRSIDWIRHQQAAWGRDRAHLGRSLIGQVPDADCDVQARITAERVRAAVAALPEAERTPIELAYFSGRTYGQVAVDLAAPEATIRSRIRTGLRHLSLTIYGEAAVNS